VKALDYLIARLREPTTASGISGLAVLIGAPPGTFEVLTQFLVSLGSLLAIVLPERGRS